MHPSRELPTDFHRAFHKRNVCQDASDQNPQTFKETDRKLSSGQGKTHESPLNSIRTHQVKATSALPRKTHSFRFHLK